MPINYEGFEGFLKLSKEDRDRVISTDSPEPLTQLQSTFNMMTVVDALMGVIRTITAMDGHNQNSTRELRGCYERVKKVQMALLINSGLPENHVQAFLADLKSGDAPSE